MKSHQSSLLMTIMLIVTCINLTQASEEDGQALYQHWCTPCHGSGQVASVYLDKRYADSVSGVLEERDDLTPEFVILRIRNSIPGMPAFRPTELSEQDALDIAHYLTYD